MLLGQSHAPVATPVRNIPNGPKTGLDALEKTKISYLLGIKLQILWSSSLHSIHYADYALPAHGYGNSQCKNKISYFWVTPVYTIIHLKVKFTLEQARRSKGGVERYSSTLSLTSALDGGGWSMSPPAGLPPGKTRYPLYRGLGGPQGQSGQVWKISPPPGFDPQTVQSIASRYTD